MRTKMTLISLVLMGATATATAQPDGEASAAAAAEPRHHSVNVNPLGALFGAYNVNYEYLGGSHGVVVEAAFEHAGGAGASATTYGAGAGWRWHWRGRQDSGFVGAMVRFAGGSAEATVTSDGMAETFDLSVKELAVTVNVGKRWQFDSGLNITLRGGAGRAQRWFSTSSTDPDAQQAVADVEDLMEFIPIALDGEVSVGYTF